MLSPFAFYIRPFEDLSPFIMFIRGLPFLSRSGFAGFVNFGIRESRIP